MYNMEMLENCDFTAFWNQKCREHGHTGYSQKTIYRYDQKLRLKIIGNPLKDVKNKRILDVGCGVGVLSNVCKNGCKCDWH